MGLQTGTKSFVENRSKRSGLVRPRLLFLLAAVSGGSHVNLGGY